MKDELLISETSVLNNWKSLRPNETALTTFIRPCLARKRKRQQQTKSQNFSKKVRNVNNHKHKLFSTCVINTHQAQLLTLLYINYYPSNKKKKKN